MGWKTLQDLLKEKGYQSIVGPRPVIEQSFQDGYIVDGRKWMEMLKSRNLTSHTYNEETAADVINDIISTYYNLFLDLKEKLENL